MHAPQHLHHLPLGLPLWNQHWQTRRECFPLYSEVLSKYSQQGTWDHLEKLLHPKTKSLQGWISAPGIRGVAGCWGQPLAAPRRVSIGRGGVCLRLAFVGFQSGFVFLSDFYIQQRDVWWNLLTLYIWLCIAPWDCDGLHHLCVCVYVGVRVRVRTVCI